MKFKQSHIKSFVRMAVISSLVFSALFTLFEQPGRISEFIHNNMTTLFGGYPIERILSSLFIVGLLFLYVNRSWRKRFYLWIYALTCYMFVSASIRALSGTGGGTIAHGINPM